jgi:16S rRNA (guanine966-N2)-methyltransferase
MAMRVIAGSARGTPLRAPRGAGTRPTSDKVREAIFDMLAAMDAPMERVLDLYAGTGALGIEALSRGAAHADFVERHPAACAALRDNLARTRLAARGRVWQGTVARLLPRLTGRYDIVFLDPPYADASAPAVLDALAEGGLVDSASVVVYEHSKRRVPPPACGPLGVYKTRCHGDTCVTIYARGPGGSAPAGPPRGPSAGEEGPRRHFKAVGERPVPQREREEAGACRRPLPGSL